MKRFAYLLVVILSVSLVSGCGKKDKKILAKVNNRTITLSEFKQIIERLPGQYKEVIKGQEKRFLDDIIMEELMLQEALKSKIDKEPETREVLAEARKKIIVSRLIKERVDDKVSIQDEELKKYYNEHSEEFMLPERWRASHILVETPEEAEELKKKISEGLPFEEAAKRFSIDAAARNGGDVGFFAKGQLIPEFENGCIKLDVGQTSDIVKTQFGYHIIKLTDKKDPEVQDFSDIKDLIKKELERERKVKLVEELMKNLKEGANITVNEELLADFAGKVENVEVSTETKGE